MPFGSFQTTRIEYGMGSFVFFNIFISFKGLASNNVLTKPISETACVAPKLEPEMKKVSTKYAYLNRFHRN